MNVTGFIQRHPKAIAFIIGLLFLFGIYASINLPVSIFPDITFPRIVIIADNGEEPANRVMVTLTKPLEEAANSIPGVRNVRSTTTRGSAEISINFDWGTDIILSQQLLQAKISSIRNQLPPSAEINVDRMNATFFPIMGYGLQSDTHDLIELRDIALYIIRPALSRIRGVSQVRIVGGRTREFLVTIDPLKIASYNLDIRQVSDVISKTNILSSVGLMDANYHLYLTLVDNMYKSAEEIGNTVIAAQSTTPIYLKDVAGITSTTKDEYIRVTGDGKESVLINIIKQPDGNTVQIANDAKKALDELKSKIPAGIKMFNFYDQSDLINESFASVRDSIGVGVILAIIVLLIFLRNWRVTFVAAIIIPATVSITIVLLMIVKETLNIMTLGGIAAAIGLIIDDTIVIVENIFRHFKKGYKSILDAMQNSIKEMIPAVLGSSASTIIIFFPFAFLTGVTGAFFKSLSLTMALALIVSLVLSLLFAPLLVSRFIHIDEFEKEAKKVSKGRIILFYRRILSFILKRPAIMIPIIGGLIYGGFYLYSNLGSGFMPEMDEGAFVLDYKSPPGTSLNETHRILMQVEKIIQEIPEVESYSRRTGTQLGFFITEPNDGDYLIKLKSKRERDVEQIISELRSKIESSQPALKIEFGQAMQDLIGDLVSVPSPIEIKIFGEDKSLIQEKAKEIEKIITSVPGVVDVFNGITISGPAYILKPDERALGLAGLTIDDLKEIVENNIQGSVAAEIQYGEKLIGVRVRFPDIYRKTSEKLSSIRIQSPTAGVIPLSSLAAISVDPGQAEISRENLKQMVAVTARISERDLGSTVDEIKTKIKEKILLPKDCAIQYGGTYETQQESFKGMLIVLLSASLLVFLVLVIEFESILIPLAIYFVALLSLFGVFLALKITDLTFNISSFMGAIMIVGIVAENSIFFAHYYTKFKKEGMISRDAIVEAGSIRIRPIFMTTICTILALFPLALGIGAGAQIQQPLAIAVIGGFSLSSILLLFVLPVFLVKIK